MINRKKKMFVENYLLTGNARQSAKDAGYKSRGYETKLLKDKEVQEYMVSYSASSNIATAQEVLTFLTSVMRGEEKFFDEPPTLSQRQKAAELLAKRYRLFNNDESNEDKTDDNFSVNIKVI